MKVNFILAGIVCAGLRSRADQVLSGDDRRAVKNVIDLLRRLASRRAFRSAGNDLRARRQNAAVSGESGSLGRIGLFVGHALERELAAGLNHGLCARRIAFARKLDENFIVAAAGKGDGRLGQAERVDAARDGFERLVHRLGAQIGDHRGLHGQQIAVVLAGGRGHGPVGELIVDEIAEAAGSSRIDIAHQNVRVVHAANLAEVDVLVVQLLAELIDGLVAALADGLLDLHLQHEMAAALQVESQLDAVGEVLPRPARAKWGNSGRPITPKMHRRTTIAMKMNFHLSWEFMRPASSPSVRPGVLRWRCAKP